MRPMSARPAMGPMTAPAIQALLEDSSSGRGIGVLVAGVTSRVVVAGVDRGVDAAGN